MTQEANFQTENMQIIPATIYMLEPHTDGYTCGYCYKRWHGTISEFLVYATSAKPLQSLQTENKPMQT